MTWPPLVELDPVALGPFEIDAIPTAGAAGAVAYLVALAATTRRLSSRGLPPRLALELFAVAAPVALAASRSPGLAARFPQFLHDGRALAEALSRPPSVVLGALAALAVSAAFAWACRRPRELADALAPGAVLAAGTVASLQAATAPRALLLAAAVVALAAGVAAVRWSAPGRAGLVAALLATLLLATTA